MVAVFLREDQYCTHERICDANFQNDGYLKTDERCTKKYCCCEKQQGEEGADDVEEDFLEHIC